MYKVSPYNSYDKQQMIEFAKAHPFALVTGIGSQYPVASQLPLQIKEDNGNVIFTGHLMRKTDHHLAFEKNNRVLVIFHSPHAYIDANWYEGKVQASTVNYMTVHAKGIITFTNTDEAYTAVKEVTDKHIEAKSRAGFENIPDDYINNLMKAIVGFSIEVTEMQPVFKLSQDRTLLDKQTIINELEKRNIGGDKFIAEQMKKYN